MRSGVRAIRPVMGEMGRECGVFALNEVKQIG